MRTLWTWAAALLLAAPALSCEGEDGQGPVDTTWRPAWDATSTGWLRSVWGPANDDLYAAGGAPNAGTLMHHDGTSWSEVQLGLDVPLLNWVYGFGGDEVFVVGNAGTSLRWDGSSWSELDTGTDQDLWGVWGASPNDLWAVGGNGRDETQGIILRFDGSSWREVAPPTLEKPKVWAYFKVWGTSADNVYIVGQRGVMLRWNGSELTELLVGASQDLISVWGTGRDRIVAVGGRNNGIVSRWDGTSWRTENLAPMRGLNGVWMRDDDTIHVGGAGGTLATIDFDTLEVGEAETEAYHDIHAVFGDSDGQLTAVGGNFIMINGPYEGTAWTRALDTGE